MKLAFAAILSGVFLPLFGWVAEAVGMVPQWTMPLALWIGLALTANVGFIALALAVIERPRCLTKRMVDLAETGGLLITWFCILGLARDHVGPAWIAWVALGGGITGAVGGLRAAAQRRRVCQRQLPA